MNVIKTKILMQRKFLTEHFICDYIGIYIIYKLGDKNDERIIFSDPRPL